MVQCENYTKHLALIQVQYEYLTCGVSRASLLIIILSIKRPILLKNEHKGLFPLPLLQGTPYKAPASTACYRREASNREYSTTIPRKGFMSEI